MNYKRILIVDDSATSRMIIRKCFQIAGFYESTYYEAEDGLKALSFLTDKRVDLVLSDLKMPRMNGRTFIRKLKRKETTKAIPVVVISSMGGDITEAQLLKEGVKAVIGKPISPGKILGALGVNE